MENSPPSERAAAVRRNDVKGSVRDDIGMDGERQYQAVYESRSHRGSVGACMFFV